MHAQPEGDVGGDVEVREQLLVLEHHADVAPVCRTVGDVDARRGTTTPAVGPQQSGDHPQQRALAGAGRAEHRDDLAGVDVQRQPVEHGALAEADDDVT